MKKCFQIPLFLFLILLSQEGSAQKYINHQVSLNMNYHVNDNSFENRFGLGLKYIIQYPVLSKIRLHSGLSLAYSHDQKDCGSFLENQTLATGAFYYNMENCQYELEKFGMHFGFVLGLSTILGDSKKSHHQFDIANHFQLLILQKKTYHSTQINIEPTININWSRYTISRILSPSISYSYFIPIQAIHMFIGVNFTLLNKYTNQFGIRTGIQF